MSRPTQPLVDEHQELFPHVEELRAVADSVGVAPADTLERRLNEAYEFLAHHLIPHAKAEERALYPVVGRLMGAPAATASMSRDHVEVGRLTDELMVLRARPIAASNRDREQALRRVLYGLYALVKVHFAKEEEIYLPLLDAGLTADDARQLFAAMEAAAAEAKAEVHTSG